MIWLLMEVIFDSMLPTMTVLTSLFVHMHLVFVVYATFICIFDELNHDLMMAVITLMSTSVPMISLTLRLLFKKQESLVPSLFDYCEHHSPKVAHTHHHLYHHHLHQQQQCSVIADICHDQRWWTFFSSRCTFLQREREILAYVGPFKPILDI